MVYLETDKNAVTSVTSLNRKTAVVKLMFIVILNCKDSTAVGFRVSGKPYCEDPYTKETEARVRLRGKHNRQAIRVGLILT